MKLSIIIPHYGKNYQLEKCLNSLEELTKYKQLNTIEIIVIFNNTIPLNKNIDSLNIKSDLKNKIIFSVEKTPGSYSARNKGLKLSKGEYIYFIDSDITLTKNSIKYLIYILFDNLNKNTIIAGKISIQEPPKVTLPYMYETIFEFDQAKNVRNGSAPTANLLFSKSLINKFGFFNTNKFSGSDKEWVSNCVKRGVILRYDKDLEVIHPSRASFSEIIYKYRRTYGGWFEKYKCGDRKLFRNLLYLIWNCRIPFRAINMIYLSKSSLKFKSGAFVVLIIIRIARIYEHLLLSFGKSPKR